MDKNELQPLCEEWQKILGLSHWEIVIKTKRKEQMTIQGAGCCTWNTCGEQAIIEICDPMDWDNDDFEQDIEKTLVHELLHIVFGDWENKEDGSAVDILHEQAIDRTAKALMTLKRKAA